MAHRDPRKAALDYDDKGQITTVMTLQDRAKQAVHDLQAWPRKLDAQKDYLLNMLRLAVADEREACARTVEDFGIRASHKHAARAIRARTE